MQEKPVASKCVAGIVSRGPILGRKNILLTADMECGTITLEIVDTATSIKLQAGDIAAVLNEAIRKSIGKEAKPDERVSKTHAGAKSRV